MGVSIPLNAYTSKYRKFLKYKRYDRGRVVRETARGSVRMHSVMRTPARFALAPFRHLFFSDPLSLGRSDPLPLHLIPSLTHAISPDARTMGCIQFYTLTRIEFPRALNILWGRGRLYWTLMCHLTEIPPMRRTDLQPTLTPSSTRRLQYSVYGECGEKLTNLMFRQTHLQNDCIRMYIKRRERDIVSFLALE